MDVEPTVDDWTEFQTEWRARMDNEFCSHTTDHFIFVTDPYDEDRYCCWCGNGDWKHHAPWCEWADTRDAWGGDPTEPA